MGLANAGEVSRIGAAPVLIQCTLANALVELGKVLKIRLCSRKTRRTNTYMQSRSAEKGKDSVYRFAENGRIGTFLPLGQTVHSNKILILKELPNGAGRGAVCRSVLILNKLLKILDAQEPQKRRKRGFHTRITNTEFETNSLDFDHRDPWCGASVGTTRESMEIYPRTAAERAMKLREVLR
jgi:hypothetical protein